MILKFFILFYFFIFSLSFIFVFSNLKFVNEGTTKPTVPIFKLRTPCPTHPLLSPHMAEFKNQTQRRSSKLRRTTPYFLGCFGFSRKVPNKKSSSEAVRSDEDAKENTCWFSRSRWRLKKSTVKTVPVNTSTVSEKPTVSPVSKIQSSKLKPESKSKSKKNKLIIVKPKSPTKHSQPPSEIEVVIAATPDQVTNVEKPLEVCYSLSPL